MTPGNDRFKAAYLHAATGMSLCDLTGRFRDVNPALCDLLGYAEDELLETDFQAVTHADDLPSSLELVSALLAGGASSSRFEKRYVRKNGDVIWASIGLSLVREQDGTPLYFLATVQDITVRKCIERERERHQTSLGAIFDLTAALVRATSLDETYRCALGGLSRALQVERACIRTFDEEGVMRFRAHCGLSPSFVGAFETRSRWSRDATNVDPVLIENLEALSDYPRRDVLLQEGIHAFANVPLGTGAGLLGHFVVCYSEPHRFTTGEVQTAQMIAHHLALMIQGKQTVEALKASQVRLAEAQRIAGLGNWEWNFQTGVCTWSNETFRIMGYEPHSIQPTIDTFTAALHPDDADRATQVIWGAITRGIPFDLEFRILRPTTSECRHVHSRGEPTRNARGVPVLVTGVAMDVTESRRAELRLRDAYQRLRDVTRHAAAAEERERRRIAREIHDELGQLVTAMRIQVSSLAKRNRMAAASSKPAYDYNDDALRDLAELNDEMLRQVRHLSASLRPAILDDLGLVAAIQAHARQYESRTGVVCHVVVDRQLTDTRFADTTASAVYRIVQELLTNVLRHAQATEVSIAFAQQDNWLTVTVHDDGAGIDVDRLRGSLSFGLKGIEERTSLLGGTFVIGRHASRGTVAELRVPLAVVAAHQVEPSLRLVAP